MRQRHPLWLAGRAGGVEDVGQVRGRAVDARPGLRLGGDDGPVAIEAQDSFERILAGNLSLTFFFYLFVNIGMVTGLLPVVGVPLPLMSYGGTSMVTLMAGFGILMSINSHRRLLAR